MLFLVKEARDIVPVSEVIDVAALIPPAYRHVGPLFACLSIWLVSGEGEEGGGFSAEVRYQDIEGVLRVENAGSLRLTATDPANPAPKLSTGFFQMKRAAPDALFELATGVVNPGTAKVAYSLFFGPAALTDLIAL